MLLYLCIITHNITMMWSPVWNMHWALVNRLNLSWYTISSYSIDLLTYPMSLTSCSTWWWLKMKITKNFWNKKTLNEFQYCNKKKTSQKITRYTRTFNFESYSNAVRFYVLSIHTCICILIIAFPIKVAPKKVQNGMRKCPHVMPAKSKSGLGIC